MANFFLTDSDVAAVKQLLQFARSRPFTVNRPPPSEFTQSPGMYAARTPPDGIPALTESAGTGGDEPGSAECEIATIVYRGLEKVVKVSGFTEVVYNLTGHSIRGSTWVLICRDMYGDWFVCGESVPGPTNNTTGTGTGTGTGAGGAASACYETLAGIPLDQIPGFRSGVIQLLGHDRDGCLEWYDVSTC